MAKKKVKKKVAKKSSVKKASSKKSKGWMTKAGWYFINLLLFVMFLYGLWLIWGVSWSQGLSLIVAILVIIFVIRLFRKLKRK